MYAVADFIKTSTGKQQPAATPEAAYVMCQAIKEYHALTGNKIGFKPAGGINCVNDALIYYTIVKEVLGEEWLNNGLFRFKVSRTGKSPAVGNQRRRNEILLRGIRLIYPLYKTKRRTCSLYKEKRFFASFLNDGI